MTHFFSRAGLSAALLAMGVAAAPLVQAASVTGMDFVGGCNKDMDGGVCSQGGNASEESVAAVLGVDEDLVTYLGEVNLTSDGSIVLVSSKSGDWEVDDSSITHLAFKGSTYHILGELTDENGTWSMDVLDWSPDFDSVTCPAGICGIERFYELDDFRNGGGKAAGLSNVRAFSVVPVPAAAWLFASGLGMLGWLRRKTV